MQFSKLLVTYVLAFAYMAAWQMATPLIPLYVVAQGASPVTVGLVISLSATLPLLFGIHLGAFVDTYGVSSVAIWSAVLYAGSFAFFVALPSISTAAVAYALFGLGQLGLTVASQSAVAYLSTPAQQDRNYSYYSFWVSVGMVGAPILGGLFVDMWGYRAAFLLVLGFTIPAVALSGRLKASGSIGMETNSLSNPYKQVVTMVRNRKVALVLLTSFAVVFTYSLKLSFYPLYLQGVGLSTTLIGLIFAIHTISSMAVRPLIDRGVLRFGYPRVLVGAVSLAGVGIALVPLLTDFVPLALASVMTGAAIGFTTPLTMSLMAGSVQPDIRGLALGLRLSVARLATVISPVIFGLIVKALGINWAFYLGAMVLCIAAGPVAVLRERPRQRVQESDDAKWDSPSK